MDVAALIRMARHAEGMSQRVLAERAGITQNALSRYETGSRLPAIDTLRRILAAAGRQIRAELEPLDADIARAIEVIKQLPVDDRPGAELWRLFAGLSDVAHRVDGLAAASILGAPIPVDRLTLSFADELATFEWLAAQMRGWATRIRPPQWPQPSVVQVAAPKLRELVESECPDGRFELTHGMAVASVALRPASDVARHVRVVTESGEIPVESLTDIEASDPRVVRVLAVLRGEQPGSDAAPPTMALPPSRSTRPPQYDPIQDRWR